MRTLILEKASDVKQLLADRSRSGQSIETLQKLNPHVDLKKIAAGTVLFLPDSADGGSDGSQAIGGDTFAAFQSLVAKSLDATSASVREGFATRAQQQQDIIGTIKASATKRVLDSSPELKAALDAAVKQDKLDQQQAKDTAKSLAAMAKQITADLGDVGRLLG